MKRILLLTSCLMGALSLVSCEDFGQAEKAWQANTVEFHKGAAARHEEHTARVRMAIQGGGQ